MARFSFAKISLSPRRNRAALRSLLRRVHLDRKGVAAVEFAILLPVMLSMYATVVETTAGVTADRKTSLLNRTVGDLVAQRTIIDDTERNNIFKAAQSVMAPFDGSLAQMSFASVVIDGAGVVKLCWSEAQGMAKPTSITIPDSLKVPNTSLVVARSIYPYVPTMGYQMTGTYQLGNDPYYLRPRQGKIGGASGAMQVERTGKPLC